MVALALGLVWIFVISHGSSSGSGQLPTSIAQPAVQAGPAAPPVAVPGLVLDEQATRPPLVVVDHAISVSLATSLIGLPLLLLIWLLCLVRFASAARLLHCGRQHVALAAELGIDPLHLAVLAEDELIKLQDKVAFDELTGVMRRAAGLATLEREVARASRRAAPLAVAFIDVDGLKKVNDSQGHAAGDQLLKEVVEVLGNRLRAEDEIFRYGGDEFCCKQGVDRDQLTIHADRGSSMASKPVAFLLADLGVTKTHSRPHCPNDNPFSEAHFKTLKHMPEFPDCFGAQEGARSFCQRFFPWYNDAHRHSGLGYLTPADVHYGRAETVRAGRIDVLTAVYATHPERFVRKAPEPPALPGPAWINRPTEAVVLTK